MPTHTYTRTRTRTPARAAYQDNVRESHLHEMFERLGRTLQEAQDSEDLAKRHKDSVAQISKKVSSLFYKLQCDQMDNKVRPLPTHLAPISSLSSPYLILMHRGQQGAPPVYTSSPYLTPT
jgi:hypothetical protein